MLDLHGSQVCMLAQESTEIRINEKLKEGKCSVLVVDVVWDVLGAYVVSKELCVYPGIFL